jgi:Fe-S cluster biogenesis protein NfuA/nitrite reductase/ring-hydroxylating ferredoxin subunit
VDDLEVRERVGYVEQALDAIEDDPAAVAAVQAVVELYGEALRRIVERVGAGGSVDEDELVAHLLLLHDLHPVDLETRVRAALDEVRPYLQSHGGDVDLVAIKEGVAQLRLAGSCDGCPSSSATMRLAIEEAVLRAAPELTGIDAEGVAEPAPKLVQLGTVTRRNGGDGSRAWLVVGVLPQLASGEPVMREVDGEPLLFARVSGTPYAYRGPCPACSAALETARVDDGELLCPACGRRYDLRRAGRCLDLPSLALEPVPLLETEAGLLKVAIG